MSILMIMCMPKRRAGTTASRARQPQRLDLARLHPGIAAVADGYPDPVKPRSLVRAGLR